MPLTSSVPSPRSLSLLAPAKINLWLKVLGRREEVWALRRGRRNAWHTTDALAVFPTAAAARAGIRRYLRLRYGLFAGCVLRRGA